MGSSALPLILLMSLVHSGLSQVKPVLTVTPDQRVFSGETVTLRCVIQGGGCIQWIYGWMKDGHIYPFITTTADFSFTADASHSGEYRCRGESYSYTDYSDGVTLTVSDKPTLTVEPQSSVFTGDTVTLSCDVGRSTGWTFLWTKDSNWESSDAGTKTISSVSVSDGGTHWCIAQRGDSYTEYSNAIQITVRERPKPVVEVKPDVRVFRGETVTLTCVIQETGVWTYSWYKDQDNSRRSDQIYHSAGQHQIYIITSVDSSHAGLVRCRGTQTETPQYSEFSDGVTLTVSDLPRSIVTVTPASPVFTGETVNLKCVIKSDHRNWRYEWYKDSVILQTSDRYTVNTDTVTISGVTESDQGQYWCKGQRDGRPKSSTSSSAVSLSVMDLQPKPELTSDPAGAALTGNTVTLTCHMDLTTGDWDYYWYKHTLNPETEKKKTHSYRLKIDSVSDGGQYWCRAGRGKPVYYTKYSDALWVNVTDGEVILESSVDPVIEGQTLTLHCLHRSTNSPISSADFYKDGSLIQNQTTGEMSITTVSKSHEGFYSCKTEIGQSPHSWISVTEVFNDQISDLKILSFLLAASPYLLATVVLLFKCYRARVSSAEDQSQYAVTEE